MGKWKCGMVLVVKHLLFIGVFFSSGWLEVCYDDFVFNTYNS